MNIYFNHFSHSISAFKEKVTSSLTPQQKKVIVIASLALSLVAASYLIFRCCFSKKAKNTPRANPPRVEREENAVRNQTDNNKLPDTFSTLPDDIKAIIFDYLPAEDLTENFSLVSENLSKENEEKFWKSRLHQELHPTSARQFFTIFKSWETAYMKFRKMLENGEGHIIHPNGKVEIGQFGNGVKKPTLGKLNGQGITIGHTGHIREGEFREGELIHGKHIHPNGKVVEGEFSNGRLHGQGKITEPLKTVVKEGQFKNGELHGKGKIVRENENICEGEFHEGQLREGEEVWFDGYKVKGHFRKGVLHGQGQMTLPSGKIEEGEFEDGVLIQAKKK